MSNCGKWRLGREIGHGAYGIVYVAATGDGERAAVKVCRRDDVGEERYARELRGAKLYGAIPHQEGLVRMREFVEEPWGFYAVMDLADDEFGREQFEEESYRPKTLASIIDGEKALPLGECVKLGISLAKGLVALQRHHLLHRDIKPGNVIYVEGRPVLSDSGLVVEESEAVSLVGTPGYVPPENFSAAAGDVYSLGLTLKSASFGRSVENLDKGPALEAETGSKLFPAWWRILNKATDPTLSRRYQSAKAMLKELEGLRRRMSVFRYFWVFKAAVGVLVIASFAFAYNTYRERKRHEPEMKVLKTFLAAREALRDNTATNETVWLSFTRSYFCRTDESYRQRLYRVEEIDPERGAQMRAILDQMVELDKKGEENNRRIKALREDTKKNGVKGASERYNQAELLYIENGKLVDAWLRYLNQFILIEDETKTLK